MYFNRHKWLRIVSYLIDCVLVLIVSFLLFPKMNIVTPQDVFAQIDMVHSTTDILQKQQETMILMGLIEKYTIAFSILGGMYDIVAYLICSTTIGKAICGLRIQYEDEKPTLISIVIRSVVKAASFAFLGSIVMVLSGFSMIASPMQLSIHDRIAKTRIVQRKQKL